MTEQRLWYLTRQDRLITGASSGLGGHFAPRTGRAGAPCVVAARRADAWPAGQGTCRIRVTEALP